MTDNTDTVMTDKRSRPSTEHVPARRCTGELHQVDCKIERQSLASRRWYCEAGAAAILNTCTLHRRTSPFTQQVTAHSITPSYITKFRCYTN